MSRFLAYDPNQAYLPPNVEDVSGGDLSLSQQIEIGNLTLFAGIANIPPRVAVRT
jgi:hypothetical protein